MKKSVNVDPQCGEGYRWLLVGERISRSCEYQRDIGLWEKTHRWEWRVGKGQEFTYRKRAFKVGARSI